MRPAIAFRKVDFPAPLAPMMAMVSPFSSVVLVEQDIVQAMKVADRVYCFQEGRLSLTGRPRDLTREQIHRAYFGS